MAYINGDSDSEIIRGTNNRDIILAGGGDDIVYGYGGNDDIDGQSGDDIIYGGAGRDWIWGNGGVNDLWGGSGADRFIMDFRGDDSSDDYIGDFQFDIDRIDVRDWGVSDFSQLEALFRTDARGDAFLNAFYGGEDHFLTIADVRANQLLPRDFIYADPGALNENGTRKDDVMFGSDFGDRLNGAAGDDVLLGGLGNDRLLGRAGNDNLVGGEGNDRLVGGSGRDWLTGDEGSDTFIFPNEVHTPNSRRADVITDFEEGVDIINLRRMDADSGTGGDQDFTFIGMADFSGAGEIRYEIDGNRTIVYGNTDADLDAEIRIVLRGDDALNAGDFIL